MPRRYHAYPPEFQVLNVLSTAGASILAVGYLLPLDLSDVLDSLRARRRPANPWGATGPRVGGPVAAADRELRGDAGRHARHASGTRPARRSALSNGNWHSEHCPGRFTRPRSRAATRTASRAARATIRSCSITSTTWSSSSRPPPSGCGCSSSPKSCSSAACSWRTCVYRHAVPDRVSRRPAIT